MSSAARLPCHYAWIIVLAGVLTLLCSLGLGRFALGMLLPSMGRDLALGYTEMGMLSTGNFIGYLGGVLACGRLVNRFGARRVIIAGLLGVGASMALISSLSWLPMLLASYLITGIGSGVANIAMMGLTTQWFVPLRRGHAVGVMTIGNSLGIMLSGALVPWLMAGHGPTGWRDGWLVLGGLVLALALGTGLLLCNHPRVMHLAPLGQATETAPEPPPLSSGPLWRLIAHLGGIYLLFSFTFAIYVTFLVTTLVQELELGNAEAGEAWIWVGLASLCSGPVFGGLSDRIGRPLSLALALGCQAGAFLILGCQLTGAWIYGSILLYNLVVWSIPSIIAATVGDHLPPESITAIFGTVTFIAGLGQVCGPALAGWLADGSGSFASSYLLAAALTCTGTVLALLLRAPDTATLSTPSLLAAPRSPS